MVLGTDSPESLGCPSGRLVVARRLRTVQLPGSATGEFLAAGQACQVSRSGSSPRSWKRRSLSWTLPPKGWASQQAPRPPGRPWALPLKNPTCLEGDLQRSPLRAPPRARPALPGQKERARLGPCDWQQRALALGPLLPPAARAVSGSSSRMRLINVLMSSSSSRATYVSA